MNRDKLRELRGQIGSSFTGQLIDALLEDDDAGWIEWGGSVIPPSVSDPVEVQFRDGTIHRGERARWSWRRSGEGDDIVRYRQLSKVGRNTNVTAPRVRRWDEWTQGERDSYRYDTEVRLSSTGMRVDKAIDIALRGTHE